MITIVKLILSIMYYIDLWIFLLSANIHKISSIYNYQEHTINEETFAGLNFQSSIPMKYFTGTLSQCIGQKHCMVIVIILIITEALIFFVWNNFCNCLQNRKAIKTKSTTFMVSIWCGKIDRFGWQYQVYTVRVEIFDV